MIKVIISGEAATGKSTVAILLENALQSAGISVSYIEDDLELKERSLRQVQRVLSEAESRGLNKYGIEVEIATCQLQRMGVGSDLKEETKECRECLKRECPNWSSRHSGNCRIYLSIRDCDDSVF